MPRFNWSVRVQDNNSFPTNLNNSNRNIEESYVTARQFVVCLKRAVPAPESSKLGAKESFRGHITSDTLGKTLTTAPHKGGGNFSCGGKLPSPHWHSRWGWVHAKNIKCQ